MTNAIRSAATALALAFGFISGAWAKVPVAEGGQARARIFVNGPLTVPGLQPKALQALTPREKELRRQAIGRSELVTDLNYHIQKMTGVALEVIQTSDPAAVQGPALVLGTLAIQMGAAATQQTPNGEALRLLVKGNRALFGGESEIGSRHAVYEWLRRAGCDWVMPGPEGEVIPQRPNLAIDDIDLSLKPDFQVRAPWYSGGRNIVTAEEVSEFNVWLRRQQQTLPGDPLPSTWLTGGHFWASALSKYKGQLDANPEMRAQIRQPDGSFKPGRSQLDPTSERVVDITLDYIRETYRRSGWSNDYPYTMSIGPNDGAGYSESAAVYEAGSARIDPMSGGQDQTDVMILYANRVAAKAKAEFPNLRLGFYIYGLHGDYPLRYKPDPSLVFSFADISYSRYHSLLDARSATRAYYKQMLDQWKKLHEDQGNIYWYYGYNWNLAENLMPYSKLKILGQDLPYYKAMGVMGHNNEQDKAWANLAPHNYLLARMGWKINLDWRAVLREYCLKAFGAGGPDLERYYLALIKRQESGGQEAGSLHATALIFDRAFIESSKALFNTASAAAAAELQKRRIDYASEPLQMLELFLSYREATHRFDFVEAEKQFTAMLQLWDRYHGLNSNLVSRYGRGYIDKWLIGPYVKAALKYSTGDYRVFNTLPDELKTSLDPNAMGAAMGLQRPEVSDRGWIKTRTFSSTWDAQGLGPYRPGAVWYRHEFIGPKDIADAGLGLLIGAYDDEVQVWLNGAYIGGGRGFIRPLPVDLTAAYRSGEVNTLAIQVIRRGLLNELGTGGLIYPSFLFLGPRVVPQAQPVEQRALLPGGSQ